MRLCFYSALLVVILFAGCKPNSPRITTTDTAETETPRFDSSGNIVGENTDGPTPVAVEIEFGKAVISADNTSLSFSGVSVNGSPLVAGFDEFAGTVYVNENTAAVSGMAIKVYSQSVWSNEKGLARKLKSAAFLDANKFPTITFETTEITASEDGRGKFDVKAKLTVRDVTREVSFVATTSIVRYQLSVTGSFEIDRTEFPMDEALDQFGKIINVSLSVGSISRDAPLSGE